MATYEYTTQDVEYLRHGDRRFMARLFKPQGAGPFPAVLEIHGGAWCNGDLNECQIYAEGLARAGIAVAAIDFRHASDGYPTSLADINYAIRWVKAHAPELNTRADLVGAAGQSSGGHLAMLAAMRPNDPRYASIPLPSGCSTAPRCRRVSPRVGSISTGKRRFLMRPRYLVRAVSSWPM